MSYGLNVEMQKQTEVTMRLNSIIGQVLPLLSQDHQQAVASVVQRAKQVTMSDLNSSIGYGDLTSGALSYETLEMHKQSEIAKRLNDIILQLLPFLSLETQQQVTASIERAKQSPISELNSSIGQQMYSQGGIPQGGHGNLSMAPHPSSGAMQGGSAASSSGSPGLLSAGSQASSMSALSPLSMASFSKSELAQQEEKRNRAEAEKQQTNMEERAYQEMAYGINAETHKQIEIAKRLNAIFYQTLPYLSQGHQQQMVAAVERAKQVTMTELSSLIGYYEMSHGFSVEMHKHAEIAKRIHGLIAQVLPFLSQEHQMQIAASVDRAKQVTMAELNFIMGGLSGVTRSEDVSSRRKPSNTGE